MTPTPEDDRMMRLAAAVTDTTDVDWNAWEDHLGTERDVVPEFKLLATVGNVARGADPWPEEDPTFLDATEPQFWGRLRLESILGQGSFGIVYKAWDPVLETHVALKLLHPRDGDDDEEGAQRALDEARKMARVNHENVVRVFGVETHDGRMGLWMELIDGPTLEEILEQQGPRSADEARTIGAAVCRALAAVHAAGFVHQDLKAHNVMREDGGRIVLTDLGLGLRLSGLAWPGVVGGSPLYLAPQLFDGQRSSPVSDIYSLGVLLFHLTSGRYPVEGADRLEIEQGHKARRRLRLRDARPSLPPDFVQVVERALARDPAERYQTAGDFEEALLRTSTDGRRSRLWPVTATVAIVTALLTVAYVIRTGERAGSASSTPAPPRAATAAAEGPYLIRASFSRKRSAGEEPLNAGSRLEIGDKIALSVDASAPVYAYVLNQDDRGRALLLYPLEDFAGVAPLPMGETRIPPRQTSEGWVVDSPGGREHFLVAVSRTRLMDFEREVQNLPRPRRESRTEKAVPLSDTALSTLRSVAGLAPAAPGESLPLSPFLAAAELKIGEESASGPWLRRITFENP